MVFIFDLSCILLRITIVAFLIPWIIDDWKVMFRK